jgi:hypothetical protein
MRHRSKWLQHRLSEGSIPQNDVLIIAKNQNSHAIVLVSSYFQKFKKYPALALKLDKIAAKKAVCNIQLDRKINSDKPIKLYVKELAAPHNEHPINSQYLLVFVEYLWRGHFFYGANIALSEYYHCTAGQNNESNSNRERLTAIYSRINIRVTELMGKLTEDITKKVAYSLLHELNSIVKNHNGNRRPELVTIQDACYFVQDECYMKLHEYVTAWRAYSLVSNQCAYYERAISALAQLLKIKIDVLTASSSESSVSTDNEIDSELDNAPVVTTNYLTLLSGIRLKRPNQHWQADTEWFHSLNQTKFKRTCKRLNKKLEMLREITMEPLYSEGQDVKTGCHLETVAYNITQQNDNDELLLQNTKKALDELNKNYCAKRRQVYRRHCAERTFFSLKCANLEKIATLACKIIDQRYLASDAESIQLTGINARLRIRTERVIQETTLALNGNTTFLGIPVIRQTPWRFLGHAGTDDFGPIETYQVDHTSIRVEHSCHPKRNKLGTSFIKGIETYSEDIIPFINMLLTNDEKKLSAREKNWPH